MSKILITGGAGFIGSNLSLKLIEKGHTVTVIDSLSEQIHGQNPEENSSLFLSIKNKVRFIKGDITNRNDVINAIKDQEIIVHFAAETGTGQSMYEIEKYIHVNIGGTALILDILTNSKHCIDKFIIASSRSLYGEGKYQTENLGYVYPSHRTSKSLDKGNFEVTIPGENAPLKLVATDEDSKIHPSSVYGITKQNQEQMVMTVCEAIGIKPVAFRYQNVFGPGQSLSNPYTGILSIFSTQIRNGADVNIFEDGKESRDFVYIDDVVNATILGIEKDEANGNIYNVGSGVPIDVLTVANTLIKYYEINVPVKITGNYRIGDIRHNYADLNKITSHLGFIPQYSFNEGIKLFTDWVKQQALTESFYDKSIKEMKSRGLYR